MPPMPNSQNELREVLQLVRENNKMLHNMRRNAFIGGFFKFVIYAILFAAPICFYMTYISNSVDSLLAAMDKLNGTTSAAETKFSGFENAMKNLESDLPAFMRPATATSTQ
jgi:hypothetical protein